MCGISGFLDPNNTLSDPNGLLDRSNEILKPRGPDSQDKLLGSHNLWGLAHARLSINDLSNSGNQPITTNSKRYTGIINGEIFNFNKIKSELGTRIYKSGSDSEIALEAIDQWGIDIALKKFRGMFAMAIVDHQENQLTLVRDPIGEKPLYYGWHENKFLFASEPIFEDLLQTPLSLSRYAVEQYLSLSYIPTPYSIFEDFYKLEPGTILKVPLNSTSPDESTKETYWNLTSEWNESQKNSPVNEEEVELRLRESVNQMMEMDASFGSFLSGGIDSSLVTSLMQSQSDKKIETFTIGFGGGSLDESEYAKSLSEHIGTSHHTIQFSEDDLFNLIEEIPTIWKEPFADPSELPTFLVSKFASQHVKVCFSGDGGDELFGGYNRYLWLPKIDNLRTKVPNFAINSLHWLLLQGPTKYLLRGLNNVSGKNQLELINDKIAKVRRGLTSKNQTDLFLQTLKTGHHLVSASEFEIINIANQINTQSFQEKMMVSDMRTYLLDDILVKVDRASMANGLEVRVPFLHLDVVAASWNLPLEHKLDSSHGKLVLRNILSKYVPKEIFDRPKSGFAPPLEDWIRGPLREKTEGLAKSNQILDLGIVSEQKVKKLLKLFYVDGLALHNELWTLLQLDQWLASRKH